MTMLCSDCGGRDAHKPDCLAVRVARGELTPREAQVLRLQSAIPCPECGRGSPLGTHDCDAMPACRRSEDGHEFPFVDHIYVVGYDRCIECGEPAPEPHVGVDFGGVGDAGGVDAVTAFGRIKGSLGQGDDGRPWAGHFADLIKANKSVAVSAEEAAKSIAHVGELYGIPVRTDPNVADGEIYVIEGNSSRVHTFGDEIKPSDLIDDPYFSDPDGFVTSPRTWMRFSDGVVHQGGRPVGGVLNFDLS